MLSFFSDTILLILPLLNSFWFLFTVVTLGFNISKLKKSALRGVMIISSITIPFNSLFQFTPLEENVKSEFLHNGMLGHSQNILLFSLAAGLIALFRLHIFGGRGNAPAKASGRINQFSFRDFFRRHWRILFYLSALGVSICTGYAVDFYFENWVDFHPENDPSLMNMNE
jgi:hypothetical protein